MYVLAKNSLRNLIRVTKQTHRRMTGKYKGKNDLFIYYLIVIETEFDIFSNLYYIQTLRENRVRVSSFNKQLLMRGII